MILYNLSIDIKKTLLLDAENREISGQAYLQKRYSDYVKLQEQSNLISNTFNDGLNILPKKSTMIRKIIKKKDSDTSSSSSTSSTSPLPNLGQHDDRDL